MSRRCACRCQQLTCERYSPGRIPCSIRGTFSYPLRSVTIIATVPGNLEEGIRSESVVKDTSSEEKFTPLCRAAYAVGCTPEENKKYSNLGSRSLVFFCRIWQKFQHILIFPDQIFGKYIRQLSGFSRNSGKII